MLLSLGSQLNSSLFLKAPNSTAEDLARTTVKPIPDYAVRDRPLTHRNYTLLAVQAIFFSVGTL